MPDESINGISFKSKTSFFTPGSAINPSNSRRMGWRRYEVNFAGQKVEMPPKELELLYFLASHAGGVFTRDQLLEQVWGFDFAGDSTRTVDVHVKRIREKLPGREQYGWDIATVWGVGYKFSTDMKG